MINYLYRFFGPSPTGCQDGVSSAEVPRLIGDYWTITQPTTDAARFYRLKSITP